LKKVEKGSKETNRRSGARSDRRNDAEREEIKENNRGEKDDRRWER